MTMSRSSKICSRWASLPNLHVSGDIAPLGINSPIANAIHNGHKSVVELLVNSKAKVDAWAYITNPTWYTSGPLVVGANAGDVEIFELLVRKGASLVRTSEHRYENLPGGRCVTR